MTGYSSTGHYVRLDRKSTRLNSSHTEIYTLSLHDALPIYFDFLVGEWQTHSRKLKERLNHNNDWLQFDGTLRTARSEEHTSELQSHRDLHSFPTRRSSDLFRFSCWRMADPFS